jgi:hypothetical protein
MAPSYPPKPIKSSSLESSEGRAPGPLLAPDGKLVELNGRPARIGGIATETLPLECKLGRQGAFDCRRRHSGDSYGAVEGYPQACDDWQQARDERQQARHQLGQAGAIFVLSTFAERQEADDQKVGGPSRPAFLC